MANQKFKAAVNASAFPFNFKQASRGIMQPGQDLAQRSNQPFIGDWQNADFNMMQMLYCENVLPIAKGIQSVAYFQQYDPYSTPVTDFDQLITIRDSFNNNASFCPARGKNYVYSDVNGAWVSYSPFTFNPSYSLVTHGYVNGRTFIFYQQTKCVEWDPTIPDIVTRTLTLPGGFAITDIRGNSGASNYHLLFTEIDILWSAPLNPLEFADVTQGAGRQIPTDLRGKITCVLPIAGGFMIYTTENVVAASFTNNAAAPFAFREVQNSNGVSSSEQVSGDANAIGHYAYGSAGIQLLTLQRADTVFAEAADFLVSRVHEAWNPTTKTVETTTLSQELQPKLQFLGSRYLIISYGSSLANFDMALVLDTALNRWGKLRVDHVDCGALPLESVGTTYRYFTLEESYDYYDVSYDSLEQPIGQVIALRQNYGFLQKDGTVMLLVSEGDTVTAGGVVIFGHIQQTRGRNVTVNKAEFDGLQTSPAAVVSLLGSETGFERDKVTTMVLVTQAGDYARYDSRVTAQNLDVAIEGKFQITNLILETQIHGKR